MDGPDILARTLSVAARTDKYGNRWQYHSRSDHHSKVACWGIIFDLLQHCGLLRRQISEGKVAFGINHEMVDFKNNRKKNLDLVLCTPSAVQNPGRLTFSSMISEYDIMLSRSEIAKLATMPTFQSAAVGRVLMALEAKACMTAHQRALPRLYDELNSSHETVHGASDQAIAAGFVMVNVSDTYLSPDLNKANRANAPVWSKHNQPRDASLAIGKVHQLPRRSRIGDAGYDAMAISVIKCKNDGSVVTIVNDTPAPEIGSIYNYGSFINRVSGDYSTRFREL